MHRTAKVFKGPSGGWFVDLGEGWRVFAISSRECRREPALVRHKTAVLSHKAAIRIADEWVRTGTSW